MPLLFTTVWFYLYLIVENIVKSTSSSLITKSHNGVQQGLSEGLDCPLKKDIEAALQQADTRVEVVQILLLSVQLKPRF